MAGSTIVARATGNWATAATWATAETTSLLDSEAGNTASTTSFVLSSTFTPGVVTVDAILMKLAASANGGGTVTVSLVTGGVTTAGTSVTLNISDLPNCTTGAATNQGGWICFAFAAPVTLLTATAYSVQMKTSIAGTATFYRDATAGNWSRVLRLNGTNNVPTTNDRVIIAGDRTAGGTGSSWTITMNATSTSAVSGSYSGVTYNGIDVCDYGTLIWDTASNINYIKVGGAAALQASTPGVIVYSGGELDLGTSGTRMPSAATAILEFVQNGADGGFGLTVKNASTMSVYGNIITTPYTTLTADIAANGGTLTVASTSGWLSGYKVVIASTTRTPGDTETVTLAAPTDGTHVNVSTGGGTGGNTVLNAHGGGGTANVIAEIGVVSGAHNVIIRGQGTVGSPTANGQTYIDLKGTSSAHIEYAEIAYVGTTLGSQHGINIETTSGACSITYISLHDGRAFGVDISGASGSVTFSNNVCYNLNTSTSGSFVIAVAATSGVHILDNNRFFGLQQTSSSPTLSLLDIASTYTNNVVAGCTTGTVVVQYNESNGVGGTCYGWNIHSNTGIGFSGASPTMVATVGSAGHTSYSWRNGGAGFAFSSGADAFIADTWVIFGNTTSNITTGNAPTGWAWIRNCTVNGDATFSTAHGISPAGNYPVYITGTTFGSTVAHATDDVNFNSSAAGMVVQAWASTFASSTVATFASNNPPQVALRSHNQGNVSGTYKVYTRFGTITNDDTHLDTGQTHGFKCTPNSNCSANRPFYFPGPTLFDTYKVGVSANPGTGVSLSANVWLSASGGTGVTLRVLGGPVAGVGSWGTDTTVATTTTGSYQALTISGLVPTEQGVIEFQLQADNSATVFWIGAFTISET